MGTHGGQDGIPLSEHPWVKSRMAYVADKEAAQREYDLEVERREHHRREKINAAHERDYPGTEPPMKCLPQNHCPSCYPPAPPKEEHVGNLDIRDLRAGRSKHATPGKRGHCKVCGKPCPTRRMVYDTAECRAEGRRQRLLRPCQECQGSLPEGSRRDREYCCERCKQAAYRKRKAART